MINVEGRETAMAWVPLNGYPQPDDGTARLTLRSTVDNTAFEMAEPLLRREEVRGDFILLLFPLPAHIPLGEYDYRLEGNIDGKAVTLSSGLMTCTEDTAEVKEYDKITTYKQYGE